MKRTPFPESGISLTVVLALLVLVATLILAIFTRTEGDRKASSIYTGSVEAGFLADTAVNLVVAQITDATRSPEAAADSPDPAPLRAWVSQPGMIRTFLGNRIPDENFRLYSWQPMRVKGAYSPGNPANTVPNDWENFPALYVDLNEPMPSLDAPSDPSADRYPILYPPALTLSESDRQVEGFSIGTVPGSTDNPLPMPVQWLYVLRDGSVHPAQQVSGNQRQVRVTAATQRNPIVGRIAFWTDDESTKVNINTAAGGEFWTPPWLETDVEAENPPTTSVLGYGYSQPVRGEFQRYPGHPARTDLRAVFPELTREEIYKMTPRVAQGGSQDGTMTLAQASIEPAVDTDRLFAALGELRFAGAKPNPGPRTSMETALPSLNGEMSLMERRKGFLTASSRAPEMTLFGTPRIAIWPIPELNTAPAGQPWRSPLDQLMAFCSTLQTATGSTLYHFTRQYPYVPTQDINFPRNRQLYTYLQRLTNSPMPGVSSESFNDKYGARGRDQILTEIFDYIRSTNLADMMQGGARRYASTTMVVPTEYNAGNGETSGFGRTFTVRQAGIMFICNADGAVPESNRPVGAPATTTPAPNENLALEPGTEGVLAANQLRIQALFIVELFSPAAGLKQLAIVPAYRVRGLEDLRISTTLTPAVGLGFPDYTHGTPPFGANHGSYNASTGGAGGVVNYRWPFLRGNSVAHDLRATPPIPADNTSTARTFDQVGLPVTITVDPSSPNMTFSGGTIEIELYRGVGSQMPPNYFDKMHTVRIEMAPVTLPVPALVPGNPRMWAFHKGGIFGGGDPAGRFERVHNPNLGDFITEYDVVQTYILPHGDYRALFGPPGALKNFVPVPVGGNLPASTRLRHFLNDSLRAVTGTFRGPSLVPDVNLNFHSAGGGQAASYYTPAMLHPYPSTTAPWTYGDWDTGSPWDITDGPLINKPDEGNLWGLDSGRNSFNSIYSLLPTQGVYGIDYHSANRQLPSPVMFGSLPTGLVAGRPWQTLLFRPARGTGHPGAQDPADHLLLDLFWMPVVEPYAISEPFSTAGKINMNWQMIPFDYIERSTGIHALLRNEKLAAIPETGWDTTKGYGKRHRYFSIPNNLYHDLDVEESLKPYRARFNAGDLFITPSEITELELVAKGNTYETMGQFWDRHRLTGENIQERIYATLYPRLTTRSNVFTVHYRVQQLRKPQGSDPTLWEERTSVERIELRGNTVVERFIDPNRSGSVVDYATTPEANAESLYRFRILSNKRF